jgi:hypothetical protein
LNSWKNSEMCASFKNFVPSSIYKLVYSDNRAHRPNEKKNEEISLGKFCTESCGAA